MRKKDAIILFKSGAQLAKALEISPNAVYQWKNDKVPKQRQAQIRELYAMRLQREMKALQEFGEPYC